MQRLPNRRTLSVCVCVCVCAQISVAMRAMGLSALSRTLQQPYGAVRLEQNNIDVRCRKKIREMNGIIGHYYFCFVTAFSASEK